MHWLKLQLRNEDQSFSIKSAKVRCSRCPGALFLGMRTHQLFLPGEVTKERLLSRLDLAPDREGRFRIAEAFCFDSAWRSTVQVLIETATPFCSTYGVSVRSARGPAMNSRNSHPLEGWIEQWLTGTSRRTGPIDAWKSNKPLHVAAFVVIS